MTTSKSKKTTKKSEKPAAEAPKAAPVKEAPKAAPKSAPVKEAVVEKKEVKTTKKQEKKSLSLKHKVGDKVSFSGEEWEVLIVVDKKGRERLRIGREGSLKAVWLEDLD